MTDEQFEKAVSSLAFRIRNLNKELDKLDKQQLRSSGRQTMLSATVTSYEYCLRDMFGDDEADRVINEAEARAAQ